MASSMRSGVTPQSLVDTFILQWRTPSNNAKVLVLVEGQDDYSLFYKFFDKRNATVKDCGGCKKIMEIFELLQNTTIVNIGIKDSDFDRLDGKNPCRGNLFYTDTHDHEMMCWKNIDTVKQVFINLPIEYDENVIEEIFNELSLISYFKWINYRNHLNYSFKAFSVEGKPAEVLKDFNVINSNLVPKSPNAHFITEDQLNEFILANPNVDSYELVNGHDFTKRLISYLKSNYEGFDKYKEENLKILLHACFRLPQFQMTELYGRIQDWSNANEYTILQMNEV